MPPFLSNFYFCIRLFDISFITTLFCCARADSNVAHFHWNDCTFMMIVVCITTYEWIMNSTKYCNIYHWFFFTLPFAIMAFEVMKDPLCVKELVWRQEKRLKRNSNAIILIILNCLSFYYVHCNIRLKCKMSKSCSYA